MCASDTIDEQDSARQHFDQSSMFWSQRDIAASSADYSLEELAGLDERVEFHIGDLRASGEHGWCACETGLKHETPGSIFATSIIAFESGDAEKIDRVVSVSSNSQSAFRETISALGWLDGTYFRSVILDLVGAKSWQHRSLGIAACGVRRINPKAYLNQATESSNLFLKTRAFKTAGQLKREDMLPVLQENFKNAVPACRFEAARSALLLGDRSALNTLGDFVLSHSKHTLPAMQVALRVADAQTALEWLKTQSRNPKRRREMLTGTCIAGNSAYIPILIKQMQVPELARAAGDAFTTITGIKLSEGGLEGAWPDGYEFEAELNQEDANTGTDPDKELSWPNADLVAKWWQQNSETFAPRTRFLSGAAISAEHCMQMLINGNQRNRHAAALELALAQADAPYFNTKAPAEWQKKKLQEMGQHNG